MRPIATYRLQLTPSFGFDDAAAVAPYLAALGVSHVYSSPYLQAAPGSMHGYDVLDHGRVSDDLGGPEAHERFCAALDAHGLRQVVDVVPNHMAIVNGNAWWADVLEHGPASLYATWFDVDWDPPEARLRNLVLLPVLGDHYGRVVESGDLVLRRDGGSFWLHLHDDRWPVSPATYDAVLVPAAAAAGDAQLDFIARSFAALPKASRTDQAAVSLRHRDSLVLKELLRRRCDESPEVAAAVDESAARLAADPQRLDALLERQNYRLAHWRTAVEELDYRRFFDITTLAGLRVEYEDVFDAVHALPLVWHEAGMVDGLRIDHPDGLRDPTAYFERLRSRAPGAWIVVEKILEPGETLPASWPVDGTTGYDFMALADGVLTDPAGEAPITAAYGELTGEPLDYAELVREAKSTVLHEVLAADLHRLGQLFVDVAAADRRYRDLGRVVLEATLAALLVELPVYRTYVRPGTPPSPADAQMIAATVAAVAERSPDLDPLALELAERVLLGEVGGAGAELCLRFQQASGPVMAKGVEDTAFYRYSRLLSRNEVGGDPARFAVDPAEYQARMADEAKAGSTAMRGTSTHDTKRSEDVRCRLALLAEVPDAFAAAVRRWMAMNEAHRTGDLPDRGFEWALYQTLVGAHPLPVERALAWAEKATREAKRHTSWLAPDPAYDAAVRDFVSGVLADPAFLADLESFTAPLVDPGRANALSLLALKLTAPGVPDLYQGTELWDLSLVDPDNRRPVDYAARRQALDDLDGLSPAEIAARADEGLPKLHLARTGLRLRAQRPDAFAGTYEPLAGDEHCLAHVLGGEVAAVATRLPIRLARSGGWEDRTVELPAGRWRDELTGDVHAGGRARLAELLATFPVALLVRS